MKSMCLSAIALCVFAGAASAIDPVAISANLSDGILTPAGNLNVGGYGTRDITALDTYGAGVIGQSITGAAFLTAAGRTTTFTFDGVSSVHGTLVGSGATVNVTEAAGFIAPNVYRAIVKVSTGDSTDLWISGLTIAGNPMTQGRLDVGAGAFTNGLLWDNLPGAVSSVSIFNALFIDGTLVASSIALANGRTLPEMGSVVVWNGVVGSGVDESWMVFDVTFVPAPSAAALLGMGALAAARRRR